MPTRTIDETIPTASTVAGTGADPPTSGGARRRSAARLLAGRGGSGGLADTVAAAAELLAEGDRAHAGIAEDARDLLLSEVEPDPRQPRRHFDEDALRELADDIGRRGVLQPILVRPPEEPGRPYRIVAGERRWRASALAGRVRIPARVRQMTDDDVSAAQLAENVLRADLSDIEKGSALRRLYEIRKAGDYRVTWEDIGKEVGLGKARIHDLFHLADLPEPVARLIEAGRLSGSHGIALQRAQGSLSEEEIVSLAQRAARPGDRRTGGFGMPVARLRSEIQAAISRQAGEPGHGPEEEAAAAASRMVRPFLRRTLDALRSGKLSDEERRLLTAALAAGGKP
jgi:ParB family chromosome partitioning protein